MSQTLSLAEEAQMRASLAYTFNTTPQLKLAVVNDGDSITEQYCQFPLNDLQCYNLGRPRAMYDLVPYPHISLNYGLSGIAMQTLNQFVGKVSGNCSTTIPVVVTNNAGTNDIGTQTFTSASQAATYGNVTLAGYTTAYFTAVRAAGCKAIAATLIQRQNFDTTTNFRESARASYNVWIRANWTSFADGFVDYDADPSFGAVGAITDITIMNQIDGIHPSPPGSAIMANVLGKQVTTIFNATIQ